MQSFVEYFECGKYYSVNQKEAGHYIVYKFSDIYEKILPFFNKYEIIGEKRYDFRAFCRAAELIKVFCVNLDLGSDRKRGRFASSPRNI